MRNRNTLNITTPVVHGVCYADRANTNLRSGAGFEYDVLPKVLALNTSYVVTDLYERKELDQVWVKIHTRTIYGWVECGDVIFSHVSYFKGW